MLTRENVIKLADFGTAKSKTDRNLTMNGATVGSPHYMPPKHVQGTNLDAPSNLYSAVMVRRPRDKIAASYRRSFSSRRTMLSPHP
jgi:serine/threonine protein kinase